MAWDYTNDYSSTISAYLSGAGTITVVSVTGLPASGKYFILKVDNEYFLCTSYTGFVLTVTGGQAGSTPSNHSLGAAITGCWIVPQVLDGIKSDAIATVVVGPVSASDGHLAVFDGATGKLVKDGGAPSTGGGVIGTAVFSASGGSISNNTVAGVITNVTRTSTGIYVVTMTSTTGYVVALVASDNNTYSVCAQVAGNTFSSILGSTGFTFTTSANASTLFDPALVSVTVMKL